MTACVENAAVSGRTSLNAVELAYQQYHGQLDWEDFRSSSCWNSKRAESIPLSERDSTDWVRTEFGYTVKLMAPQFVEP